MDEWAPSRWLVERAASQRSQLSLRKKILLAFGLTLFGLLELLYGVARVVMLRSFAQLQEQDARQNLERASSALADDLSILSRTTGDYAAWDRTYAFVGKPDNQYVKSELPDAMFIRYRINVFLVFNNSGNLLVKKALDLRNQRECSVPRSLDEHISAGSRLLNHTNTSSSVTGVIILPEGPMLIASRPIVTGEGKGPIRGSVIAGRYLDSAQLKRLADITHLSLSLYRLDDPEVPAEFRAVQNSSEGWPRTLIRPLSSRSIAGYELVQDLYGKPALVLEVELPREIYQRGQASLLQFMLFLLLAGSVFAAATLFLLEKTVLARVVDLSSSVGRISASGDLSARLSVDGRDEITGLGETINRMLGALEDSQKERYEREARLRLLVEQMPAVLWTTDADLRFTSSLGAGLAALNLRPNQLVGKSLFDYFGTRDPDFVPLAAHRRALLGDSSTYDLEWRGRILHTHVEPLRTEGGGIAGTVGIALDTTERKRAEEALRESEHRYRSLVENALVCIHEIELDGRISSMNPAGLRMLGESDKSKVCGSSYLDVVGPGDRDRVAALLARAYKGESLEFEFEAATEVGSRVFASSLIPIKGPDGSVLKLMGVTQDVTEHRGLERQLRQAQKMEAVGQLAGGIAHDFNNLLMVIKGHSELMLERLDPSEPMCKNAGEVKKAADRAASLTRQLLAFSRMQVLQPKILNLNAVIAEMGKMLPRLIPANIELTIAPGVQLGQVRADLGQIEQVIMNLALNARDAMPQGGKLTIGTANIDLDEAYARRHAGMRPGRYVMLAVSDTGVGMDAETQARIFEPFFTTKEVGRGTGLGLATVYGVVKQSGGWIWVYSEPGRGSTFKIFLPLNEQTTEPAALDHASVPPPQGVETILLVEDQDGVRELAFDFLKASGYTVLVAEDGCEALLIAERHQGPIHLLVTDLMMPKMGGRELASRVGLLRPETKVLFMSGYAEYAAAKHDALDHGIVVLEKPFSLVTLACKVREVLETGGKLSVPPVQESVS